MTRQNKMALLQEIAVRDRAASYWRAHLGPDAPLALYRSLVADDLIVLSGESGWYITVHGRLVLEGTEHMS